MLLPAARRRPLWNKAMSCAASSRRVAESASFVSFQLCCNPSWRRKRRPRGWTTEDYLMWAEALMSFEILGCCHLIQYRGVYLGRAKCHCCHLTSVPVYWIRPCTGEGQARGARVPRQCGDVGAMSVRPGTATGVRPISLVHLWRGCQCHGTSRE
jgi:hypothetical protein